jgi:hypothetical protein
LLKRATAILLSAALGLGAALAVAACGEDRPGSVTFEGDTGTATGTTPTATETTPTATTAP